ncbi:MAG: cytochrome c class I [Betaproteobacteria bacterium HGW-Betaproteobacteria-12]|nr:MAG: cytochrome c class I [Betaproteobacteria bacterium HGW-Betaproteobacteria-12]
MLIRAALTLLAGACLLAPATAAPALVEAGRAVYNYRCYFCHGYSGDGQTLAATYLSPRPTNFKQADPARLNAAQVLTVLREGRPGTAMKPFVGIISEAEMQAVAAFVVDEFVQRKADNTRYHTVENGWPEHERYQAAFPFAKGEIPLSRPWENLSENEAAGKRLYLSSCVSCHDRGAATEDDVAWESRPLSYPRNHFSLANPPKIDAMTSASPYALHDIPPKVPGMTRLERRGKRLFEVNCAFCHGHDGSGQNWIGRFLEPPPRDLRSPAFMRQATPESLTHAIREGLPNTSMPAWKSVLGNAEIRAILAYINRAFHPIGKDKAAAR